MKAKEGVVVKEEGLKEEDVDKGLKEEDIDVTKVIEALTKKQ